jgi:two-component system sensor histidine kinase HydH
MKKIFPTRFMFVSPWLIAASIGLMTLIIVVFATNNLRREINLINDELYHRGQSLARFVGAGTRASMMQGMEGSIHTQRLIEQASIDPSIFYIAVVDGNGKILAHSTPELISTQVEHDISLSEKSGEPGKWHVVRDRNSNENVFEVVSEFSPFRHQRQFGGRGLGRMRLALESLNARLRNNEGVAVTYDWCKNTVGATGAKNWQGSDYRILVGLDMKDQEKVTQQAKIHILLVSLILFFVGLGGWFSLLAAQTFQASQSTLKNIQAFTNLLILKLPVGIIATDKNNTITTFNKAMSLMTGLEPEAALAKNPEVILPSSLAAFFDVHDAMEEVFEKEVVIGTGGKLIAHVSSVPVVDANNHPHGRVLLVHDLTELKKLEKHVNQHDRLVALGKMAAGVAHEVRNPLSSIKGFATLLGEKFSKESDEHKAADLLVNEVERLNRSITELLNYSRPLPLQLKKIDLGRLVDESVQLMQGDAGALGVSLTVRIAETVPMVLADGDRIKQVLLNLYLNAFQAMENGGDLNVTVKKNDSEDGVVITVVDSGCGIAGDLIKRVTDPYFTTKPDGTGLGLALAYKIIDEHGGSLQFSSTPGEGTAVEVFLPV